MAPQGFVRVEVKVRKEHAALPRDVAAALADPARQAEARAHTPALALLERLRDGCPEFAGWWEAHDIRAVGAGRKRLHHPNKGLLSFEYASFQANDDPALKLVIHTPVEDGETA